MCDGLVVAVVNERLFIHFTMTDTLSIPFNSSNLPDSNVFLSIFIKSKKELRWPLAARGAP